MYPGRLIAGGQELASIEDGTTHTIVMAEIRTLDSPSDSRGAWALPWPGATLLSFDMHPNGWETNHDGTGAGDGYHAQIRSPYEASSRASASRCDLTIKGLTPTLSSSAGGTTASRRRCKNALHARSTTWNARGYMTAAPRSQHPGGVNGAYIDGHVQFLPDDIDEFVMAYSVSVNDGEITR